MEHLDSLMLPGVPAGFFSRPVAQPAPTTGAEYSELQTAMIDALTTAPDTIVPTPGWRDSAKKAPASEVLSDIFCSAGDALQGMLIGLLPHLCKSPDPVIRLQAMAIVSSAAAQYAAFHEADLREQRAESELLIGLVNFPARKQPPGMSIAERAERNYPDSPALQQAYIHAVALVRSTKRGWLLDKPITKGDVK